VNGKGRKAGRKRFVGLAVLLLFVFLIVIDSARDRNRQLSGVQRSARPTGSEFRVHAAMEAPAAITA
jgi:hypothetical protein